jgi:hypothetical protein
MPQLPDLLIDVYILRKKKGGCPSPGNRLIISCKLYRRVD